jgi:hypothetical protein
MEESVLRWETHEYTYTEKSTDWYWTVGIITLILAGLSVYFGNALFAIVLLLGILTLVIFASRHPEIVLHEINDRGIEVGHTLYPYDTLSSFFVEHLEHRPGKIILASKKVLMPHIAVSLGDIDPTLVRQMLLKKLPEVEHHQSIFVHIAEYLGF